MAGYTSVLFTDATLAPTEAVDSTDLDTGWYEEVVVVIKNGNTTQTRSPILIFKDAAGTEIHRITPSAISANTTTSYSIGIAAGAAGVTAGYSMPLPPKLQLTVAAPASGAGNGYVAIWGK